MVATTLNLVQHGSLKLTHFLLFQRLKIAREFGDKAAERRANSNLGNSYIFLGHFETAADHYKLVLNQISINSSSQRFKPSIK